MKPFKLFRVAGIQVYLSWWWFLLAIYEVQARRGQYSSTAWNIAEYLALFAIVLTHEFGHALATRQVGGHADRIMLWPLGGVAYVDPPQRPGAMLWAIAAGPLVNVALAPLLYLASIATRVPRVGPMSPPICTASQPTCCSSTLCCSSSTSCPSTRSMAARFCAAFSGSSSAAARA